MSFAIVSGADFDFFEFLVGLVYSIRDKPQGQGVPLCIFDMGLTAPQRQWLTVQGATIRKPEWPYKCELSPADRMLVTRPQLPEYFPGYDLYVWVDADAWVQSWDAVEAFCAGAMECGFSVAPERHPSYALTHYWSVEFAKAWFGPPRQGTREVPINAGVFAGLARAPHWKAWHRRVADVVERPSFHPQAHFALDQAALGVIIDRDGLPCAYPSERNNFLCNHGTLKISEDGALVLEPYPPYQPLGIVHNAGKEKKRFANFKTPSGARLSRGFTYISRSLLPAGDYISPGLTMTLLDRCFPNMVKGDSRAVTWPYLRREIPHNWYVDKRDPNTGFINRDEAHILYNSALRFRGKRTLEIGCHMGWSACHLAIAGVNLDIIDPALGSEIVQKSVVESLEMCAPAGEIRLYPEKSPNAVERIALEQNMKWSLFFIDGDHSHPGPVNDVVVCEKFAEDDAMMLFHDLAAPDVSNALAYLRNQGWNIRIYHTAQIMGVAWRGSVAPIDHEPDPTVTWTIPSHLRQFL